MTEMFSEVMYVKESSESTILVPVFFINVKLDNVEVLIKDWLFSMQPHVF